MRVVVIGGERVGQTLAGHLDCDWTEVTYLDEDRRTVERAVDRGVTASSVDDLADVTLLADMGLDIASVVVVATARDSVNLLVAQLVRTRYDAGHIVVRLNDPQNRSSFEDLGVETVCSTSVLAEALVNAVAGPA